MDFAFFVATFFLKLLTKEVDVFILEQNLRGYPIQATGIQLKYLKQNKLELEAEQPSTVGHK